MTGSERLSSPANSSYARRGGRTTGLVRCRRWPRSNRGCVRDPYGVIGASPSPSYSAPHPNLAPVFHNNSGFRIRITAAIAVRRSHRCVQRTVLTCQRYLIAGGTPSAATPSRCHQILPLEQTPFPGRLEALWAGRGDRGGEGYSGA